MDLKNGSNATGFHGAGSVPSPGLALFSFAHSRALSFPSPGNAPGKERGMNAIEESRASLLACRWEKRPDPTGFDDPSLREWAATLGELPTHDVFVVCPEVIRPELEVELQRIGLQIRHCDPDLPVYHPQDESFWPLALARNGECVPLFSRPLLFLSGSDCEGSLVVHHPAYPQRPIFSSFSAETMALELLRPFRRQHPQHLIDICASVPLSK